MKKILAVIVVMVLSINTAFVAFAAVSISLAKEGEPVASSHLDYSLAQGEGVTGVVVISNSGVNQTSVRISALDQVNTNNKVFVLSNWGDPQTGIGKWTTLEQEVIELAPAETKNVKFTMEIPEATKVGKYGGGIAVEEINGLPQEGAVKVIARTASKIFVDVTPKPIPTAVEKVQKEIDQSPTLVIVIIVVIIFLIAALSWGFKHRKVAMGYKNKTKKK